MKLTDDDRRTAVHVAALNGHGHIIAYLAEAGSDVDAEDEVMASSDSLIMHI